VNGLCVGVYMCVCTYTQVYVYVCTCTHARLYVYEYVHATTDHYLPRSLPEIWEAKALHRKAVGVREVPAHMVKFVKCHRV
jgi:hypothetical protein